MFRSAGRPSGLNTTNDQELYSLLKDIEDWRERLPADLQFRGPETPTMAGEFFIILRRDVATTGCNA